MSDIQTLRYIACVLLEDTHGINDYGWELIEKELLLEDITDVLGKSEGILQRKILFD